MHLSVKVVIHIRLSVTKKKNKKSVNLSLYVSMHFKSTVIFFFLSFYIFILYLFISLYLKIYIYAPITSDEYHIQFHCMGSVELRRTRSNQNYKIKISFSQWSSKPRP